MSTPSESSYKPLVPDQPAAPILETLEQRVLLSGDVAFAVNAGGPEVTDGAITWLKDKKQNDLPYNNAAAAGSSSASTSASIDLSDPSIPPGTPEAIFQRLRHDPGSLEELQWDFPVTPGLYDVRLYFAEIDDSVTTGDRLFDIDIEGQDALTTYDVFAAAGGLFQGVVETYRVASDGNLDIDFFRDPASSKNPQINGIQIVTAAAPDTLNATSLQADFGLIEIGDPASQQFTLTNLGDPGDPDITFGAVTQTAGDAVWNVTDLNGIVLAPGQSTTLTADYVTAVEGAHTGTFTFAHSGLNSPITLDLTGSAVVEIINEPPVMAPIADVVIAEFQSTSILVTGSDFNGDALALTATFGGGALPGFVTFTDHGDGTATIDIDPLAGDAGSYSQLVVTATETGTAEGHAGMDAFDLTVAPGTDPADYVYRINSGGKVVSDVVDWEADRPSPYTNAALSLSGPVTAPTIVSYDATVPVGTPAKVFEKHRQDPPNGETMQWDFPVAPGLYEVRLYFSETDPGAFIGGRVFDVQVEGLTVLDDFDIFAEHGLNVGTMRSFVVQSDGTLDIDFLNDPEATSNPMINGIEVIDASVGDLGVQVDDLFVQDIDFGTVQLPDTSGRTVQLTNLNPTENLTISMVNYAGDPVFTEDFDDSSPLVLTPGQSTTFIVDYNPTGEGQNAGAVSITYAVGAGSDQVFDLAVAGAASASAPVGFNKGLLTGIAATSNPTTLQWGPDGRLYVGHVNGTIHAYTVARLGEADFTVTATETIELIHDIPNHNEDGTPNTGLDERLLTGLYVAGTAQAPVIYASSSDPRGDSSGENFEIDSNSGILSRLTLGPGGWTKTDLVRGLPRSKEVHAGNGLQLDTATNTLYLAIGGLTNAGAPSDKFSLLPEYAYSAAILSFDLTALEALPDQLDPVTPDTNDDTIDDNYFKYDLPTLDDEDRDFDGFGGDVDLTQGIQDVFGGNNGKNQARLVAGGPVQIYSPGWRNPYDLVIHSNGSIYAIDNGANLGWGDVPILDDNGTPGDPSDDFATNQTHSAGTLATFDNLQRIDGPGYYAGSPNPTRANTANTFNPTNPQSPVAEVGGNPAESFFTVPQSAQDGALTVFPESTNGLTEYTASNFGGALQGDLLAVSFFGSNTVWRMKLDPTGTQLEFKQALFTSVGVGPLDVTAVGDQGLFPGTIWVADFGINGIVFFEPSDSGGPTDPNDLDGDGYTNDDEDFHGTDPNNAGDVPPDNDADLTGDLIDDDDDNDTILDDTDAFAIDATNGLNTGAVRYDFDNTDTGFFNLGFTGLMSNGTDVYHDLLNLGTNGVTGGAGQVLTIAPLTAGNALGGTNTQQNALQFGVNPSLLPDRFKVSSTLVEPYLSETPLAGQRAGIFLGTGDQDNFLQFVLTGGNTLEVYGEVNGVQTHMVSTPVSYTGLTEVDLQLAVDRAAGTVQPYYELTTQGAGAGGVTTLGGPVAIPATWLDGVAALAVGIVGTTNGTGDFSATWDFIEVAPNSGNELGIDLTSVDFGLVIPGAMLLQDVILTNLGGDGDPDIIVDTIALSGEPEFGFAAAPRPIILAPGGSTTVTVQFDPTTEGPFTGTLSLAHSGIGGMDQVALSGSAAFPSGVARVLVQPSSSNIKLSSTFGTDSFRIFNDSPGSEQITRVTLDLGTSILQDVVFDPNGTAGDTTGRDLTPGAISGTPGFSAHSFAGGHDGGFDIVHIDFTDFDAGESFFFGLDTDPTTVNGATAPGPENSASINGAELTGATVTVHFSDGTSITSQLFIVDGTDHASEAKLESQLPDAPTAIEALGVSATPIAPGRAGVDVADAAQTIRVSGTDGQSVRLLQMEGGQFLDGVPGGGFDVDAFEANSALNFVEHDVVIGPGGFVDVPVTLTDSGPGDVTGYNHFIAVAEGTGGETGLATDVLILRYVEPVAPQAIGIYVSSSAWTPQFLSTVDPTDGLGHLVSTGAGQLDSLVWGNLDQIKVRFDGEVAAGSGDLVLEGLVTTAPAVTDYSFDYATSTATWTFATPLPIDKYRLTVSETVLGTNGLALDGEWQDGVSTVSGDGNAGGSLVARLNVLPGDAVNSFTGFVLGDDLIYVRDHIGLFSTDAGYSARADLNGDGAIDGGDLSLVSGWQFSMLPFGDF